MLYGIDISHHNKDYISRHDINLRTMAQNGFVLMKASEGITYKDTMLDQYYNIIHNSDDGRPDYNIQYGFYHYAHPEKNRVQDEINNFLRLVKHHAGHCIYALDIEQDAFKAASLDNWVYDWCTGVYAATGVKPIVYCQKSGLKKIPSVAKADFGLWLPAWQKTAPASCKPWEFWAFWQYDCSKGLDYDCFNGNKEQFHKYCMKV